MLPAWRLAPHSTHYGQKSRPRWATWLPWRWVREAGERHAGNPLGLGKEWRDGHVLLYTGACRVVSATDELSNEGPGGLRGGVPVL